MYLMGASKDLEIVSGVVDFNCFIVEFSVKMIIFANFLLQF